MDKSYNGYTNQETWIMALYLNDNIDWAEDCESAEELKETLCYIFTEETEEVETISEPLYELLKVALAKVNWYEIASNMFEEYNEEEE